MTPAQLFAADSSGMLKVDVVCAGTGRQYGSGFLLGPRLMMTARHVLISVASGDGCRATVVQNGTGDSTRVVRWMAVRAARSRSPADLALGVLARPLTGYDFSLSTASPQPGQGVLALAYGLAQQLSLNQGRVTKRVFHDDVRLLEMNLAEEGGASGGPVLNANGAVVAIVQFGGGSKQASVDLAHLSGNDPTQFCFGVAVGQTSTICPRHDTSVPLLSRDGPPELCAGFALDEPFEDCPKFAEDLTGVVQVKAQCPQSGGEGGSGFLLGPRLLMTARSILVDPASAAGCRGSVVQPLTGRSSRIVRWMGLQVAGTHTPTDIAIAVLAAPLKGYDFTLSSDSPPPGNVVHVLGYLGALPLPSNGARVVKLSTINGIRQIKMAIKSVDGDGGGPIVNAVNQVVGVDQWGSTTVADLHSVDLASITNGDPTQLCFGLAWQQPSTICRLGRHTQPDTFVPDGPPELCGAAASDPPFSYCQSPGAAPDPSISACWVGATKSPDGSSRISRASDVDPAVYFHVQLDHPGSAQTNYTVVLTSPDGTTTRLITDGNLAPLGASFFLGPIGWGRKGAHITDGTWTFRLTLSSGRTCSASFAAAAP